ncbi:hypothetical protein P5F55_13795 [Clostridium perfringens]|uniref:hypothetical protein n=1 Tax=Clostridium perfringens TaxID=1502 RepID=UPI00297ADC01|nr:hypothetical protein [Clostridium perfringens]MDK0835022.1 hypothetical protein [Clostridium perfringens]MDK0928434.1 hypothetical protein [Clostridium perfringens]MDM0495342.1 hypothetical protein [Clostridium perfringens]MDM0781058.1 hypothetical protein [Clostridium perfringens]
MGIKLELKGIYNYVQALERRIQELEKKVKEKDELISKIGDKEKNYINRKE